MHVFEEAIAATATRHAPWFVVPAVVQSAPRLHGYVEAMVSLDLPEARRREKKELAAARVALFRKQ
jgi:polyphosphate kinase 2 (PPK2 family)